MKTGTESALGMFTKKSDAAPVMALVQKIIVPYFTGCVITVCILWIVGIFVLALLGIYLSESTGPKTQVIKPKPGIECVVVSAVDSISVDCWKASD